MRNGSAGGLTNTGCSTAQRATGLLALLGYALNALWPNSWACGTDRRATAHKPAPEIPRRKERAHIRACTHARASTRTHERARNGRALRGGHHSCYLLGTHRVGVYGRRRNRYNVGTHPRARPRTHPHARPCTRPRARPRTRPRARQRSRFSAHWRAGGGRRASVSADWACRHSAAEKRRQQVFAAAVASADYKSSKALSTDFVFSRTKASSTSAEL